MNNYNQLKTMNIYMSVDEILSQIKDNIIVIDDKLKRNIRWNKGKQDLFIDSLIKNYPVPSLFFYEEKYNSYTIIDGVQRLIALKEFVCSDNYGYESIRYEQKQYFQLSANEKRSLLTARIPITIISFMENSQEIVSDVFYRLNIGGESLNNQELRNRLFPGDMLNAVERVCSENAWQANFDVKLQNRYKDYELVLKFFTAINKKSVLSNLNESINTFLLFNRFNYEKSNEYELIILETLELLERTDIKNPFLYNGRFSTALYEAFFIPLGLFVSENSTVHNIKDKYRIIYDAYIDGKLNSKNYKQKIEFGYNVLKGEYYDI